MTVVYLDRVAVLNLLVDYLLLLATATLAGTPLRRLRFGVCAALGALMRYWCSFADRWHIRCTGLRLALCWRGGRFTVRCGRGG